MNSCSGSWISYTILFYVLSFILPYLVFILKWLTCPTSVLLEKFDPRNIAHMPAEDPEPHIGAARFFMRLDLNRIRQFLDGHLLTL